MFLTETPEGYTLTPYDPALEEEMEAGRAFMREYRDTFTNSPNELALDHQVSPASAAR